VIQPGATLGLIGGGQLGRMFTQAAQRMGFEVVVLDPDPKSPAGRIATRHIAAAYTDSKALTELGQTAGAVTTEFENVPAASLAFLLDFCPVHPSPEAVEITQDRVTEKTFSRAQGLETAPFAPVLTEADCATAFQSIGAPALLKTARLGYDGKGQASVASADEVRTAFLGFKSQPCILEARLPLEIEISVVLARGEDGDIATFPVAENRHENGILDVSVVPARVSEPQKRPPSWPPRWTTSELWRWSSS
jgi:5-(carboxyamino)imidazole ribonucleotide synthase